MKRSTLLILVAVALVCVAVVAGLLLCASHGTPIASTPSAPTTSTPAPGPQQSTDTWYPPTADRIAYARRIGGVSHMGQTLYVILAATEKTEAAARARLDAAIPKFGDTELYYVVQKSDNFKGLPAGDWVVIESYRDRAHAVLKENLDFGRLVGPDPRVVKVVVETAEPIPVYEDLGPSDASGTTAP